MKNNLITIVLVLLANLSYSQDPDSNMNSLLDVQVKSPGLTDFIKYGNLSSSSYTGELRTSIPIVNVPIHGQSPFNLSLSYVGSGFRPSKRNGLVGQNWFLTGIGVITRQVNEMPDDQRGQPNVNGSSVNYTNGFLAGVRSKTHDAMDVFNFSPSTSYESLGYYRHMYGNSSGVGTDPNNYEGSPDEFSFNFNGMSGKFYIGNDGQVKVASDSQVKLSVDLSEMALQNNTFDSCIPNGPSRIIIKDDRGNKYFFGGETKNLEYTLGLSVSNDGSPYPESDERPVINAWYLYEVQYYNGYTLKYNYRDDSGLPDAFGNHQYIQQGGGFYDAYVGNAPNLKDFLMMSEYFSQQKALTQWNGSFPGTGGTSGSSSYGLGLTLQKAAILESIVGDDFEVKFSYSRQEHKFNTRGSNPFPYNNIYFNTDYRGGFVDIKLDKITLKRRTASGFSTSLKHFDFSYDNLGGNHSRMFLSSFGESGKNKYKFEYYPTGALPKPITLGTDHWNFWNGKNENSNQITPTVFIDPQGD